MSDEQHQQRHLERLREWRNRKPRDQTLAFLVDHVKAQVVRPHRQVGQFAELWQELVPPELAERTSLGSFTRGILTIHVADSATLYQLDRLLRGGVEQQLRQRSRTTLRSVRLKLAAT